VFALAGVTGSLLVFYVEIDAASHRSLAAAARPASPPSYETVLSTLQAYAPQLRHAWRIEAPDEGGAISARYYKTKAAGHRGFAPLVVWVDPQAPRVVRQGQWGDYLMTWIYDLHYTLLMGEGGKLAMAGAGAFTLVLLVGGTMMWWPAKGKLRTALTLKPAATPQRRIYDLHKIAGIYGLAQLTVLTATGVMLDAPAWFRPLLAVPAPLYAAPDLSSASRSGAPRITVDRAVAIAQARFPDARLRWIETPDGAKGVYRINLRQAFEPSRRFPRTNVWIDQYSGAILAIRDPRQDAPGDVVLNWLHPIHSGEAGGLLGRLIVLATGLGAPVLFVTGLIRWIHKRQARRRSKVRAGQRASSADVVRVVPAQRPNVWFSAESSPDRGGEDDRRPDHLRAADPPRRVRPRRHDHAA
jgi:uncharacterized iron-regulated membrane protein